MVGLPLVFVSGWTLYKREVLGQDARALNVPKLEEGGAGDEGNAEGQKKKKKEVEGGVRDPKTGQKATIF